MDGSADACVTTMPGTQHELLELLARTETRERSELAELIHDEPIQRIVAGLLRLDVLVTKVDSRTGNELEAVAEQLELAVDWLRNIIVVALTPPDLSDGLGAALTALADGIFTGTPTTFRRCGRARVPLTLPAKEAAYRIIREAMVNARNHARASTVTLGLEASLDEVVLTLTDDGIGSPTLYAGPGHFGLTTMRARADAEGGRLSVESIPGLGTTVILTLPVGVAGKD